MPHCLEQPAQGFVDTAEILQAVAYSNNKAANLLRQGRYTESIDSFLISLKLLKRLQKTSSDGAKNFRRGFSMMNDIRRLSTTTTITRTASTSNQKSAATTTSPPDFVYTLPIFLDEDEQEVNGGGDAEITIKLTAIVVFNLSLTHHLNGSKSPCLGEAERKSEWNKAMLLYELSMQVQLKHNIHLGEFYKLAIPNNLGQVCSLLGKKKRAKVCFQFLQRSLAIYSNGRSSLYSSSSSYGIHHLFTPNLDGFRKNIKRHGVISSAA